MPEEAPTVLAPPSVVYEEGRVIAYIDARGKPTSPDKAAFVRVWTKDGLKTLRRAE